MKTWVISLLRDVLARTSWSKYAFYTYDYMFTPAQLAFLCECIDQTRRLPGPILEIGCADGRTTVFLNKHMAAAGIAKDYYCIDTFSGFTSADVAYERGERGKVDPYDGFRQNKQWWFDQTMRHNGVDRVHSIAADVNEFDFSAFDGISVCLIDVDLYRPVRAALEGVYDRMAEGGLIVVDDCAKATKFDGAHAAYREFTASRSLPQKVVLDKLGVVERI